LSPHRVARIFAAAKAHELIVDDAVLVWVVHDTNPHALSPKVKSFVQAQHWFQDLTTIGPE
jgi:peptide/nickel transport system substrate-binding protein